MKCKNQSNKKPKIRLPLGTICGVAGIIGIASIAATSSISASALSYSTSSDVSFTFAPTLSIGLSTDSLNIDNLVPGNISDSNSVKVTVSSNTPYGYVLSASVGSSDSTSTYYNTSNLVHEDSTVNNAFTSIDTSASLANLTTDNTWGYSTSLDGGTTWSTYSGLPSTTTKPLLDISDPATPSTIDFKIAAKSSTTQASGTYNNIITFYAVGKPEPVSIRKLKYMQDFRTLSSEDKYLVLESMPVGQQYKLIDDRDNKTYWIAKQADGNIWMTQNLDLTIDSAKTYTEEDTDVNSDWHPVWVQLKDPGDRYWNGNFTSNSAIYNTTVLDESSTPGGSHYHIGNWYDWATATAIDNPNSYTYYRDLNRSICPAGWRLPTATGNKSFYNLYNAKPFTRGENGDAHLAPNFFSYSDANGTGNYIGNSVAYWSSTVYNTYYAYRMQIDSGISLQGTSGKGNKFNIRCVAR